MEIPFNISNAEERNYNEMINMINQCAKYCTNHQIKDVEEFIGISEMMKILLKAGIIGLKK